MLNRWCEKGKGWKEERCPKISIRWPLNWQQWTNTAQKLLRSRHSKASWVGAYSRIRVSTIQYILYFWRRGLGYFLLAKSTIVCRSGNVHLRVFIFGSFAGL